MYYLIGIKHSWSKDVDVLEQDSSYDVLARIQKVANIALTSDDPYPLEYKQFKIVDSLDNFNCCWLQQEL